MSAAAKTNSKSQRKRDRQAASAAAAAVTATSAEDRSVRQRCGPVAAAASSSSAASASTSGSAGPRLAFMRLAVVERQLIMQGLDFTSLARIASTCKQLRQEALQKEAGKCLSERNSRIVVECNVRDDHPAHSSPLFRRHAPVSLSFSRNSGEPALSAAQRQALFTKASRFSRITSLVIGREEWTKRQAVHLLAQPWIQTVTSLRLDSPSSVWLSSSAVQHALFALPRLASLQLDVRRGSTDGCLLESALSLATKLTEARVSVSNGQARCVRAPRALPALHTSNLSVRWNSDEIDQSTGPLVWCVPPTLTSLFFSGFSHLPELTPRSALKTLFTRLPNLRVLRSLSGGNAVPLLQGLLDAGVSAVPNLLLVTLTHVLGVVGSMEMDRALFREFLHKFPAAFVRFETMQVFDSLAGFEDACMIERTFRSWPRVIIPPLPSEPPPSPHASDDEAASDVELEEEPSESEEQM